MFGRWPSSAAVSGSLKPGAVRVRSKGEKYWIERFQVPAGQLERLRGRVAVAEHAAVVPVAFGADHGVGEERGPAAVGEQDPDLRRGAVGEGAGLGPLEQDVAVRAASARSASQSTKEGVAAIRLKFGGAWLFQAARPVIT